MTQQSINTLVEHFGQDLVLPGESVPEKYWGDWSTVERVRPTALARPRTTEDVVAIVSMCRQLGVVIVPQGGRTGLVGGACATNGELVLSLERMNAIEEVDISNATMTVQAGVLLQVAQERASEEGFMLGIDLGARGSCTIGGNLATNAGGNRVIRYGMTRDNVLGVEAVLPDGSVSGALRKMIKNNTGYDLKNLLIGSEGTLGIITRAVLKLRPMPTSTSTAWCGVADYASLVKLLRSAQARLPGGPSSFEVMWPSYVDFAFAHCPNLRRPLQGDVAFHVLIESDNASGNDMSSFDALMEDMLEEGVIEDAAIASSVADAAEFWAVRDALAEFVPSIPNYAGFDLSFSILEIREMVERCTTALKARWPDCIALFFGHLGDGNLHAIVQVPNSDEAVVHEIETLVYRLTAELGGVISAEHGIGIQKRPFVEETLPPGDVELMRKIKRAIDPDGMLNPGKLVV